MAELTEVEIREQVRARYAAAAKRTSPNADGCCGSSTGCASADGIQAFGASVYSAEEAGEASPTALKASLGCGVPTAVAELQEGETVLDLGSGAGADVLISARRVGPTGTAIGVDMTDEMLEAGRRNAAEAGVDNARFAKGYLEDLPLRDQSVDVVISNCVINLATDKPTVIREAARVLRSGGRVAISDVIADADIGAATRADMEQWTGCVAGALTRAELEAALAAAGLVDIEVRETHRVHEQAGSAIVRARKPDLACCDASAQASCCEPAAKNACCDTPVTSGGCGCQHEEGSNAPAIASSVAR
jgi:arsenite methyltransferase